MCDWPVLDWPSRSVIIIVLCAVNYAMLRERARASKIFILNPSIDRDGDATVYQKPSFANERLSIFISGGLQCMRDEISKWPCSL